MAVNVSLPIPHTLTDEDHEIARLMVDGLDEPQTIRGKLLEAGWPLSLEQAAIVVGWRTKFARNRLEHNSEFHAYRGKMLNERRNAERARNLRRAVLIRDDAGQGEAVDRMVQLKAIQTIEGPQGKGVTVNVNSNNQTLNVQPGYIIRLPAKRDADSALPADTAQVPLTIEGSRADMPDTSFAITNDRNEEQGVR